MPGYNPNAFFWNHYCTRWHIFGFYFFLNLPVWVCLVIFCKHYCAEKSVEVLFWQSNGIILLLAGYSHTGRIELNFQGAHLVPGHGQCLCCTHCIMGTAVLPVCIVDPQTSNWSQSSHKGPWRLKHFPWQVWGLLLQSTKVSMSGLFAFSLEVPVPCKPIGNFKHLVSLLLSFACIQLSGWALRQSLCKTF